jgi:hypothetical protein
MSLTLSKTETKLLKEAAAGGGILQFPDTMKPITRERTLGHLEAERLIIAGGLDGTEARLTAAAYRAVGVAPPRDGTTATKRSLVRDLLRRSDGASLGELIAATGWLPHTTRAALSRLRSAGELLAKAPRPDGTTAYRIQATTSGTVTDPEEPAQQVAA